MDQAKKGYKKTGRPSSPKKTAKKEEECTGKRSPVFSGERFKGRDVLISKIIILGTQRKQYTKR